MSTEVFDAPFTTADLTVRADFFKPTARPIIIDITQHTRSPVGTSFDVTKIAGT